MKAGWAGHLPSLCWSHPRQRFVLSLLAGLRGSWCCAGHWPGTHGRESLSARPHWADKQKAAAWLALRGFACRPGSSSCLQQRCCFSFPSWPSLLALLRPSACPCATLCWPGLILFSYPSPWLLEASRFQLWFLPVSFLKESYFVASCPFVLRFVFLLPGWGQHLFPQPLPKGTLWYLITQLQATDPLW